MRLQANTCVSRWEDGAFLPDFRSRGILRLSFDEKTLDNLANKIVNAGKLHGIDPKTVDTKITEKQEQAIIKGIQFSEASRTTGIAAININVDSAMIRDYVSRNNNIPQNIAQALTITADKMQLAEKTSTKTNEPKINNWKEHTAALRQAHPITQESHQQQLQSAQHVHQNKNKPASSHDAR